MKLQATRFIPIISRAEGMRFDKVTCRVFWIESIEHAAAFREIAIRSESHRLPFAVAVNPAQSLRDITVKPSNRTIRLELFKRLDASVLATPDAEGDSVTRTITSDDESSLSLRKSACVICTCRMRKMMLNVNDLSLPL